MFRFVTVLAMAIFVGSCGMDKSMHGDPPLSSGVFLFSFVHNCLMKVGEWKGRIAGRAQQFKWPPLPHEFAEGMLPEEPGAEVHYWTNPETRPPHIIRSSWQVVEGVEYETCSVIVDRNLVNGMELAAVLEHQLDKLRRVAARRFDGHTELVWAMPSDVHPKQVMLRVPHGAGYTSLSALVTMPKKK